METKQASLLSNEELAELFTNSFRGYMGSPVLLTAEGLVKWCAANYAEIPRSYVFYLPEEESPTAPVGFGVMAVREDKPTHSRLASMGVVPECQGKGVGGRALGLIIEKERERGVEVLELEVITSNERGVKLYKSAGFEITRELVGWEKGPTGESQKEEARDADVRECSVEEVDALVKPHCDEDLAWQAWGFSKSINPLRAFTLNDEAYCVIAVPEQEEQPINPQCVFVRPESRGKGLSVRLAKAVEAKFPGRKWMVKPVFPREYEKVAKAAGFTELGIAEYQMRLKLK
jgi:ribosomal protein S18 acetylase RimI-like enzyme/predicted GNAT family acetyltransferase